MLATALLIAGTFGGQPDLPRHLSMVQAAPPPHVMTVQRSGFPKLYRCASPIEKAETQAAYSPACVAWRADALAGIRALPVQERIARVAAMRMRMGVAPDEGLGVSLSGKVRPVAMRVAMR